MEEIMQKFMVIKDPRHSGYIKYKLADVLSIIMCAVLCGFKAAQKLKLSTPYADMRDSNFKRIQYNRYADDFVVGVIGSKQDALSIKED